MTTFLKGASVVDAARSQLGVREATGQNDGLPSSRYMRGKRTVPWCAYFAVWCFEQAGLRVLGNWWKLGSVTYLEGQMASCGTLVRADQADDVPPGAMVFFWNRGDSDTGPGRHCGIVEAWQPGLVSTIEGNVGNAVRRRSYATDSARIAAYAWI